MRIKINNSCYIYLGDCLEIMPKLRDESIDLIITDPPYGIRYKSNRQGINRKKSVESHVDEIIRETYFDEISGDEIFPTKWIEFSYKKLKNNSAIYVFCHWKTAHIPREELLSFGFYLKNLIVLNKSNHGMGDLDGSYAPKYELLWFACKNRHLLNFQNGREKDVWDVPIKFTGTKRLHPNEKSISWMMPAILNSSNESNIVLDPFMGSGSTGEACLRTNRRFIGIEKDEKYFQIAKERLERIAKELEL